MGLRVLRQKAFLGPFVGLTFLLASSPGGALGADFIRGDVNGDGEMSLADFSAILGYLFRGHQLDCLDAADVNDSGCIDVTDPAALMVFVFRGGEWAPPPPFPEPGPDPTPDNEEFPLDCGAYGGGAPFEDPGARIEVVGVDVEPADGAARVLVAISHTVPILGLAGVLRFEPNIIRGVSKEVSRVFLEGMYLSAHIDGDRLHFAVPTILTDAVPAPPGQSVAAVEILVCLDGNTPTGEYPVVLESGELVEAESYRTIVPSLGDGEMLIDAEVTGAEGCLESPPPPPLNAVYELVGGTAPPGATVGVTFKIRADAEVQGYAFSVDFEEDVLEAIGFRELWQKPDGTPFSFAVYEFNNERERPGNHGVDEGFVVGTAVIDIRQAIGLPADTDNEVLRFRFRVRPETTARLTELRFLDGGQGSGEPVPNFVTANGFVDYTQDGAESFIFINTVVAVAPDVITFVRGDANGDANVDISDPQATLGYLFLGQAQVGCFDAADANDDGTLNIADPVYTLEHLFRGGPAPPPPFPDPGTDPSEDSIFGCL